LHCGNGEQNSDETGIDCGGSCGACQEAEQPPPPEEEESDGGADLVEGGEAPEEEAEPPTELPSVQRILSANYRSPVSSIQVGETEIQWESPRYRCILLFSAEDGSYELLSGGGATHTGYTHFMFLQTCEGIEENPESAVVARIPVGLEEHLDQFVVEVSGFRVYVIRSPD